MLDCVVVGGGLVGLATARALQERGATNVVVLEKEATVATHQSGHNSGVLHAGIYYAPGSLKAQLCREGKQTLERYAVDKGIPVDRCGKVVVATHPAELPRLAALHERASANAVPGLRLLDPPAMREVEPHVVGLRALYSPNTAIIDFVRVAQELAADVHDGGGAVLCGREVTRIEVQKQTVRVATETEQFVARSVVTCAGLQSDRVTALTGSVGDERIVPFRGNYYQLAPEARALVRGLVYPVPDPRFPFLGVHLTRRIDGQVWAGPNAVLALSRENYRRRSVSGKDTAELLSFVGFWRLARQHYRFGAGEQWRDVWKGAFLRELQRYVPELQRRHLRPGPSGIRAQSVRVDGALVDDFSVAESARVVHVRNAPSPAATSSLAIGGRIAAMLMERAPEW